VPEFPKNTPRRVAKPAGQSAVLRGFRAFFETLTKLLCPILRTFLHHADPPLFGGLFTVGSVPQFFELFASICAQDVFHRFSMDSPLRSARPLACSIRTSVAISATLRSSLTVLSTSVQKLSPEASISKMIRLGVVHRHARRIVQGCTPSSGGCRRAPTLGTQEVTGEGPVPQLLTAPAR
jgi:hypothetical protein